MVCGLGLMFVWNGSSFGGEEFVIFGLKVACINQELYLFASVFHLTSRVFFHLQLHIII